VLEIGEKRRPPPALAPPEETPERRVDADPTGLLALQRSAGNAATARLLAREVGTLDAAAGFLLDLVGGRPELITPELKKLYGDFGPQALRRVQWLREDRPTSFADANRVESLLRYLDIGGDAATAAWADEVAGTAGELRMLLRTVLPGAADLATAQWALKLTGGNVRRCVDALDYLMAQPVGWQRDVTRRELERARGDVALATVQMGAMEQMRGEAEQAGAARAQEEFDTAEAEAEKAEKDAVAAVLPSKQVLKKRDPKNKAYAAYVKVKGESQQTRVEAVAAAETTRAASVGPYSEAAFAPVVKATEDVVPTTVAWLRGRTTDEALQATLGRVMTLKPGPEGETLAEGVLEQQAAKQKAVAGKLEGLIGKVDMPNLVEAAAFLADHNQPDAARWVEANGARPNVTFGASLAFLARLRKVMPTAVRALEELGLSAAETLETVITARAAAVDWALDPVLLPPAHREAALARMRTRPLEADALQRMFTGNAANAGGHTELELLAMAAQHGPAICEVALSALWDGDIEANELDDLIGHLKLGKTRAGAVHYLHQAEISLPANVSMPSMVEYNDIRCPRYLQGSGWATDEACLKHYEEMGARVALDQPNPNPTKAKLESYYADIVAAIQMAVQQWSSLGKPAGEHGYGYGYANRLNPNGKGQWRINLKKEEGRAVIFHVDSNYASSYWVSTAS
jgi:hypothetical protein